MFAHDVSEVLVGKARNLSIVLQLAALSETALLSYFLSEAIGGYCDSSGLLQC
jgi:hypothetical protein